MYRTLAIILFVLLSCFTCFGQMMYYKLKPGESTKRHVEQFLGQPLKKVSEFNLSMFTGGASQYARVNKPFKGLVPGKSTNADVERVLGQPVVKVSDTLYEYASENVRYRSCAKVFVQFRKQSAVVERIEAICESNSNCLELMVQAFEAVSRRFPAPEATIIESKGTDKERQLEYFGKPYYAVHTVILNNGSPVSCRMGFYSVELYEAALPQK